MFHDDETHIEKLLQALENAIEHKEAEIKQKKEESRQHASSIFNMFNSGSEGAPVDGVRSIFRNAQETLQSGLSTMQEAVEEDPWGFLRKVAMGSWSLGLMLGSHFRKERK
jgi:hypothetical protein